ncbi:MAG: hypothetical protein KJ999_21305 [Gammaproteobacteria bacterium]|nr:hypothetical protein [Gammaproteobacteria bacterium]
MKSIHTLCPYLAIPLSECKKVNGEHILASALGTPESFKIDADASENQRLNVELDAPMMHSEMLQLLAVANGVVSRTDKDHVVLTGALPSGDAARLKLAPGSAEFSLPFPVEKDPTSGLVTGVKGFGSEAQELADKVLKGMEKRGLQVEVSEPRSIDSNMKFSMEVDLNHLLRFMCRTAYLMTVATLGDAAIASPSGEQYRRAINTIGLTGDTLLEIGIEGRFLDAPMHPIQFANPHQGGHTLACVPLAGKLVTYVVLFGVFHATFITPNPCARNVEPQSLVFFIDPATKACTRSDFVAELNASRVKIVP